MKGKICVVTVFVLLVLSLITASVVMAQTLKYIPFPQEISDEFYYTDIDTNLQSEFDDWKEHYGVTPVYGEEVRFYGGEGGIVLFEFSSTEDAKKGYSCLYNESQGEEWQIAGINTFGDESISFYYPGGAGSTHECSCITLFRNSRFVMYMEAGLEGLDKSKVNIVRYTLPEKIDAKLEQLKVPTPTPTHSIPAFQIITAISTLLAVAYLLRRKK